MAFSPKLETDILDSNNIFTVSKLNNQVARILNNDLVLSDIYVAGEISNYSPYKNGNTYFTLKDAGSELSCILFTRSYKGNMVADLGNGLKVILHGHINVYEIKGTYSLVVDDIKVQGEGDLAAAFQKLKNKLEKDGFFDKEYKRPLPKYPKTVGIVTAPGGAAVRDIISIAKKKNPYVQLILYPAIVQGDDALDSVINGIHALEDLGVDVMIVGRGGGSLEDLWTFNEEALAHVIFDSTVPIISAVGHETDYTIADMVADVRAETPTKGAELAVPDFAQIAERYNRIYEQLDDYIYSYIDDRGKRRLQYLSARLKAASPENKAVQKRLLLGTKEEALDRNFKLLIERKKNKLKMLSMQLQSLNPEKQFSDGICYVLDKDGNKIKDISGIKENDNVKIVLKGGEAGATIDDVTLRDLETKEE